MQALVELAAKHVGAGYRQLSKRLRRAGWIMNSKRVYRLYVALGLAKRKKRPRRRLATLGKPTPARLVNEMWSIDFMSDRLNNSRSFRMFAVVDVASRECLVFDVNPSMAASRVVALLNGAAAKYGLPLVIVCDNGPEFRSHTLVQWAERNGVHIHFIDPGRPMQNGFVESFNGTFRSECVEILDVETIAEAREVTSAWVDDYNNSRPHSSIGDATPSEYERSNERIPYRGVQDGRATRGDNLSLMEKFKTPKAAFPTFPQAPPLF